MSAAVNPATRPKSGPSQAIARCSEPAGLATTVSAGSPGTAVDDEVRAAAPSSGPTGGDMNRRLTLAIRIVVIGVIAAGLWWFVREMDFAKLGESLRSARAWPLVLAAALNFVCLWGKAACWRIMLAPRHKVRITRLFRYTIAAFAASVIAPARAGEVLWVWTLKRRDGVPADAANAAM